jgi:6-phosphogluconolactonase
VTLRLFVGTYSTAIHTLDLDEATGQLAAVTTTPGAGNPSWLEFHPTLPVLYAAHEHDQGAVTAYRIDGNTLAPLSTQATRGADPCHLAVDPDGRALVAANYTSGHVTVLPLGADGAPGPASQVIAHAGASLHPNRQAAPHPHHIGRHGAHLLVSDLGLDAIVPYRLDAATLVPDGPAIGTPLGGGPRRFVAHPTLPVAYVLNEIHASLTRYRTGSPGGWHAGDTVTMLPPGWNGPRSGAELALAPGGTTLYATLRGHDSIARFAVDPATGALAPQGHTHSGGASPRHFEISRCGSFLATANQRSHLVSLFRLDPATGTPTPLGTAPVPTPACVRFAP